MAGQTLEGDLEGGESDTSYATYALAALVGVGVAVLVAVRVGVAVLAGAGPGPVGVAVCGWPFGGGLRDGSRFASPHDSESR